MAAKDKESFARVVNGPFEDWADVSPSDTVSFAYRPRAVYIGGAGDVTAVSQSGTVKTFKAVPVGTTLNIRPVRINSTNTTATLMLALY